MLVPGVTVLQVALPKVAVTETVSSDVATVVADSWLASETLADNL